MEYNIIKREGIKQEYLDSSSQELQCTLKKKVKKKKNKVSTEMKKKKKANTFSYQWKNWGSF